MIQTKGFDQKTTVLQCVIRTMRSTCPECLDVAAELQAVCPATKLPMDVVTSEAITLRNQFSAISQFVARLLSELEPTATADRDSNERYGSMAAFLRHAEVSETIPVTVYHSSWERLTPSSTLVLKFVSSISGTLRSPGYQFLEHDRSVSTGFGSFRMA
jgi:hypothetical protein